MENFYIVIIFSLVGGVVIAIPAAVIGFLIGAFNDEAIIQFKIFGISGALAGIVAANLFFYCIFLSEKYYS